MTDRHPDHCKCGSCEMRRRFRCIDCGEDGPEMKLACGRAALAPITGEGESVFRCFTCASMYVHDLESIASQAMNRLHLASKDDRDRLIDWWEGARLTSIERCREARTEILRSREVRRRNFPGSD